MVARGTTLLAPARAGTSQPAITVLFRRALLVVQAGRSGASSGPRCRRLHTFRRLS